MSQINLKRNILMSGSFRIIVMILTFFTSVISTRYLGVELKGKSSYLITLGGFVWMALDLGLFRSYPYLVRKHPEKINSLFAWSVFQFVTDSIFWSILGLCFINIWSKLIGFPLNQLYIVILVMFITTQKLSVQLQSLYLGLNKIWIHSLSQLFNSLSVLLLITVGYFVFTESDRVAFIILASVIASFMTIIYYIASNAWGNEWYKIDFKFIFISYQSGFRVFLSTLFIMLLIRFDIIIIKRMLDFKQVGLYSIAAHIVDLLQIASNLVGGLLLVKLSDCNDDIEKWKIMKKLLMSFFTLLVCANIGFVICGKFLITTLYGTQFLPVYYVFIWLIPASFGLSFGSLFNMYLNSKGFPVISIILPAISLIINVILNLLLIPVLGIYGSALATSIAYVLWFLMIVIYEQRCSSNQMFKHLIPHSADWRMLWQEALMQATGIGSKLCRIVTKNRG